MLQSPPQPRRMLTFRLGKRVLLFISRGLNFNHISIKFSNLFREMLIILTPRPTRYSGQAFCLRVFCCPSSLPRSISGARLPPAAPPQTRPAKGSALPFLNSFFANAENHIATTCCAEKPVLPREKAVQLSTRADSPSGTAVVSLFLCQNFPQFQNQILKDSTEKPKIGNRLEIRNKVKRFHRKTKDWKPP